MAQNTFKEKLINAIKSNQSYSFRTDSIIYKSVTENGQKKYYVEGYISTTDIDIFNDLVTPKAMESMLKQISEKTIMLDYDHEAWRNNNSIIPVGKIISAKQDDKGLWVRAQLNSASPKFKDLWESIKGGFIKAFSIAFKPIKTAIKTIGDTQIRLLDDLILLNVALTGAPVNQSAVMTGFGMKSIILKSINDIEQIEGDNEHIEELVLVPKKALEEFTMAEKETIGVKSESSDKKEEVEKKQMEEEEKKKAEEEKKEAEEKAEEEEKEDEEEKKKAPEQKAISEMMKKMDALIKENKTMKAELKSLQESSVFKSKTPEAPELKSEVRPMNILDSIR